jgi:hypothetical protein
VGRGHVGPEQGLGSRRMASTRRTMSTDPSTHRAILELGGPVPQEVCVASPIVLNVKLSCPCGCGLDSGQVRLVSGDMNIATCEANRISFAAPAQLGAFTWVVVSPPQEISGVPHGEVSLPISFATSPVGTSVAVWDVPSPVIIGARCAVRVGAKSAADCVLEGATIEIVDEAGTVVGSGRLGGTPWEGTCALYWTEVEVSAPAREGIASWRARFPATDIRLPHTEAEARFSIAAVRPPECRLTMTFVDRETEEPIESAHIRLGPFRAVTDASGRAELSIPAGPYEVKVWHHAYETPSTTVEVNGDLALQLHGVSVPEEDPNARWMM